jgi:MFS family permease
MLAVLVYGSWFYGFGVIIDDVGDDLGVGLGVLGFAYGAANILTGVFAVFAGRRLDVRGPFAVFIVVGPLGCLLYAMSAATHSPVLFVVAFSLGGGLMGASAFYAMTQAVAVRLFPDDPIRTITRITIWGALSSPIAIPLTEVMRDKLGWREAVVIPAAIAAVAYVATAFATRHMRAAAPKQRSSGLLAAIRNALGHRAIRLNIAASFTTSIGVSVLLVFQVPTMKWAGLTAATAASLAGLRGVFQLAGRLPLPRRVERSDAWRLLGFARVIVGVSCLVILGSGNVAIAIIYVVVAGAAIGALSALDGMVSRDLLPPDDFGSLMGAMAFIYSIGSGVAPIIAGQLNDVTGSPLASMTLAGISSFVSAALLAAAKRAHRGSLT